MSFTKAELDAIRAADAEIDAAFRPRKRKKHVYTPEELRRAAEYSREYARTHREERRAYDKRYYQANRDVILAKRKAYIEANKEKISAYQVAYRQRKKQAEGGG